MVHDKAGLCHKVAQALLTSKQARLSRGQRSLHYKNGLWLLTRLLDSNAVCMFC